MAEPLVVVTDALREAKGMESLVRPLLALVQEVTGLESAYLTEVDEMGGIQRVLFSVNAGELEIGENLAADWSDSVCRQSLEKGLPASDHVARDFPASESARQLGIHSYVGVPVVAAGGEVFGTLCAVSRGRRKVPAAQLRLLNLCAEIIAAEAFRERTLVLERERTNTQQAYTDAVKALEKHKTEMLRLTAHELRGPIGVARGHLELVGAGDLGEVPEPVARSIDTAARQLDHMDRMVAEMLEAARLEDARLVLHPGPADLVEIAQEAVAIVAPRSAGLHRLRVEAERPAEAVVDRARVLVALTVLLDNAVKYSPAGGDVILSVSCGAAECTVRVEDEGIGIPPARVGELFRPFGRLRDGAAGAIKGTGLGLYLARELVRLHGGDIQVRRRAPKGSCFEVRLPRQPAST